MCELKNSVRGHRTLESTLLRKVFSGAVALLLMGSLSACSRIEAHLYGRAEGAQRVESYAQAVKLYQEYLKKYPRGEFAEKSLYNLGNIYYLNLRDTAQAKSTYERFLDVYPTSQYAFVVGGRLAELYERDLQDYRKAIDLLEQVSMRTPSREDWRRVRFEIADDYFRLDEFDQAIIEFNKLIQEEPDDHRSDEARIKLAAIYEIRKQWRDAINQLQQVLNQTKCAECRRHAEFEVVDCYASLERYDQAIATLKQFKPAPEDQKFVAQRLADLERLKQESRAPQEVNWQKRPRRRATSSK